jgi:hypothetical protein
MERSQEELTAHSQGSPVEYITVVFLPAGSMAGTETAVGLARMLTAAKIIEQVCPDLGTGHLEPLKQHVA